MAVILITLSPRLSEAVDHGRITNDVPIAVDALQFLGTYRHRFRCYYFPTSASSLTGHVALHTAKAVAR